MNADDPTPRVGFAQLKNMIGRRVLFVGRVEGVDGGVVRMAAPDGSKVAIQANSVFETPFAEVQGVVVDPQTIKEESHVNFGENFGAWCGRRAIGCTPRQRGHRDWRRSGAQHGAPPAAHAPLLSGAAGATVAVFYPLCCASWTASAAPPACIWLACRLRTARQEAAAPTAHWACFLRSTPPNPSQRTLCPRSHAPQT